MQYAYIATFEPDGKGGYFVRVPALPGCVTAGKDLYDAALMGTDAMAVWLASAEERGVVLPEPDAPENVKSEGDVIRMVLCADTDAYRLMYPPNEDCIAAASIPSETA